MHPAHWPQFQTFSRGFALINSRHPYMSALRVDKRPLKGKKWGFAAVPAASAIDCF